MIQKVWRSIEEVPFCFSKSSIKLQGHTAKKIVDFDSNWVFPDYDSSLNSPMAKMMENVWGSIEEVPCFSSKVMSTLHGLKNRRFWPKLGISGLQLQF